MTDRQGLFTRYEDVWLIDAVRTPFADYNGVLGKVSPIDLGIKTARAVFERSGVPPGDVQAVITGAMAQASFDAYVLPRHIGLYAGVPEQVPAHLVQRVCGTGIETLLQAADGITLGRMNLALCAAAESMSRNPIAAYTHRDGFPLGKVEFKDFLWEALKDTCVDMSMGDTAERLAHHHGISREEADAFASRSFARAAAAWDSGFLRAETVPVVTEVFEHGDYCPRGIQLPKGVEVFERDSHVRESPVEVLAGLKPVFGGVQTAGNSSGIVDGAAAALVGSGGYLNRHGLQPLARIAAAAVVGVPPDIMGTGPMAAIGTLLRGTELSVDDIGRVEINEAFAAQCLVCIRELGLDEARVNVNGGAIAIGHPLAVSGLRLAMTASRELRARGDRYGIASACIGGGQGIALLVENPAASPASE